MPVPQYIPFRQKVRPFSVSEITSGLTPAEVITAIEHGARFIAFPYVISAIYISYRRISPVRFLAPGESTIPKALPYVVLSLLFGWWSIPHGFINTPEAIYRALRGGKDITPTVLAWAQNNHKPSTGAP